MPLALLTGWPGWIALLAVALVIAWCATPGE